MFAAGRTVTKILNILNESMKSACCMAVTVGVWLSGSRDKTLVKYQAAN